MHTIMTVILQSVALILQYKSCRTESELLQRIKNVDYTAECANTRRFRDEFVQYGVGATEMCIKKMFGEAK